MPQIQCDSRLIKHNTLSLFCTRLLVASGLVQRDAALVADMLVTTNLRGIDSHGIARLPHYLCRIEHGSINPRPDFRLEILGPAVGRLDGNHGLGHLVMHRAAQAAVDLARNSGAGWIAVRNSSHAGAMALYGLQIADAGMIGLVFAHVDPMVLPFGAKKSFCGTNPLCITAPRAPSGAKDIATGALCLDMATSKVPWNTIANAAMEGVPIERGWAVDAEGRNTTDAVQVVSLYPVGEYKGSGLGLMIDVFCSMLSDSPYGPDIPKMYGDLGTHRQLGGLVGAIDIARFVSLERFHARVSEMIERWNALPPASSGSQVLFPGQPELITRQKRLREGIPVGRHLLDELDELAARYHVANLPEDNALSE
ncbi:MAG: Ldh family oxidoreductase [Pirellulales bacterium]|nr:Ldh family oxidoreductase [Pirellulales bacterium]